MKVSRLFAAAIRSPGDPVQGIAGPSGSRKGLRACLDAVSLRKSGAAFFFLLWGAIFAVFLGRASLSLAAPELKNVVPRPKSAVGVENDGMERGGICKRMALVPQWR